METLTRPAIWLMQTNSHFRSRHSLLTLGVIIEEADGGLLPPAVKTFTLGLFPLDL